jgi:hypothetical protein
MDICQLVVEGMWFGYKDKIFDGSLISLMPHQGFFTSGKDMREC